MINKTDHVGVPLPSLVYVLIAARDKFDRIDIPMTDHSRLENGNQVLTKEVQNNDLTVVFQYWLQDSNQGVSNG